MSGAVLQLPLESVSAGGSGIGRTVAAQYCLLVDSGRWVLVPDLPGFWRFRRALHGTDADVLPGLKSRAAACSAMKPVIWWAFACMVASVYCRTVRHRRAPGAGRKAGWASRRKGDPLTSGTWQNSCLAR
jgi:hypothetical protein